MSFSVMTYWPIYLRDSRLPGRKPTQESSQFSEFGSPPRFFMKSQMPYAILRSSSRIASVSRIESLSPPISIHQKLVSLVPSLCGRLIDVTTFIV